MKKDLSEPRWNMKALEPNGLKMIDLFCGAGVGASGFLLAGYDIVYAIDNQKHAVNTYKRNIGEHAVLGDIRKVKAEEIPDADVITGGFPCFTGETLITTSKGLKEIRHVKVGDLVLTHKGHYKKVLTTMKRKTNSLYILDTEQIPRTFVTAEHPFYAIKKKSNNANGKNNFENNPQWITTRELSKLHYIGMAYYKKRMNPYHIKSDEAYLLGKFLAIGDYGYNRKIRRQQMVFVNSTEWLPDIKDKFPKLRRKHNEDNRTYVLYSKRMIDLSKKFFPQKRNSSIPQSFMQLPQKIQISFLNGYLKEKGKRNGTKWILESRNKKRIFELGQLIQQAYGVSYTITSNTFHPMHHISNQDGKVKWKLEFDIGKENKTVIQKHSIVWNQVEQKKIMSFDGFVYNLEVEDDNSYVANNMIVHNCQPFSVAGKGEGINDEKQGDLGYHFYRIICDKQPKAFLMENVGGVLTKKHRAFFDELVQLFEDAGYNVTWDLINCYEYGVPQLRKRVFVIGIRKDLGKRFVFPEKIPESERTTIRDAIGDLPDPNGINNHRGYGIRKDEAPYINKIPPGGNWKDLSEEEQKAFLGKAFYSGGGKTGFLRKVSFDAPAYTITSVMNGKNNAQIIDNQDKYYKGDFSPRYKSRNRQKQWDEPSFTIVSQARQLPLYPEPANYDIRKMDEMDVPPPRRFTVRECLRLQTVPDWFSFSDDIPLNKQYERCSGIPSLVAYKFGIAIAELLNS